MYISPSIAITAQTLPVAQWSFEDKVALFKDRVDGWHLEVADRVINGWLVGENQAIACLDRRGDPSIHVPDSGWAVLQIVMSYFEIVGLFKCGVINMNAKDPLRDQSKKRFLAGFFDVYLHLKAQEAEVTAYLYEELRSGLYHTGIRGGHIVLIHTDALPPVAYMAADDVFIVDPHRLTRELRTHLNNYCRDLLDPTQADLRNKFKQGFSLIYET